MTEPDRLDETIARIRAMSDSAIDAEATGPAGYGRFEGLPAKVAFGEDGRSGTLIDPIGYYSESDMAWPVPAGAWLDGASIPRAFWSIIGGPFEGRYREASIVHDHYCITKSRPWRDTHRMFHGAMLCRGVQGFQARMMFYAVYRFGPRWADPESIAESAAPASPMPPADADAATVLSDAQVIRDTSPSAEEIEALADRWA